MDNDRARELTLHGGTLLCLDVPEGTQIGFDNKLWTSGPLFKGIKMIPPGIHMFYTMTSNAFDESSPVNSYFLRFVEPNPKNTPNPENEDEPKLEYGQVILKKWNRELEEFHRDDDISSEELSAYTEGVHRFDFDKNLAPYPYDDPSTLLWKKLTKHVSPSLLKRILPLSGVINGEACSFTNESTSIDRQEKKLLSELDLKLKQFNDSRKNIPSKSIPERISKNPTNSNNNNNSSTSNGKPESSNWGVPNFTKIPITPPKSLNIKNMTKWNMDKSQCLEYLLKKHYSTDEDIIGEMEFSYVLFVYGLTWSGFQQWKALVSLFLQCDDLVQLKPTLFTEFFQMLYNQISESPEDMFQSDLTSNIFLKPLLKSFIESNYSQTSEPKQDENHEKLFKSVIQLKNLFESKFKLNLNLFNEVGNYQDDYNDDDDEEDKPMIILDVNKFTY
ncbi:hypothetical protein DLAC_02201 [Tieghemostelium lacteum]|uniref:AAR2-domain-containing protein n=1 Tax=Tieghemostelium lacteum TaxID=361077 RepID=A0A152A4V1_TIELA|nr:hypothetical protein DLAC_02201 [Tieghemostelium lacteum]|eukprot:KYR01101.1 hypothetical protein DLAC_02201 [Tieghemostelium lacteum]